MSKKFILIGSIPTDNPQTYGGTTVLMKQMIDFFEESGKSFLFIQSNKFEGMFSHIINYIYIIFQLIRNIRNSDIVMVNVARNGAFVLSPILYVITKIFRKRFIFRMFGGNFIDLYNTYKIRSFLARKTFFKSDILFFETKEIIDFFEGKNNNVYWFPNVRKYNNENKKDIRFNKKFVFISSVKQTKGINEILEVSNKLDDSYSFDIYGPIQDNKFNVNYFDNFKAKYKGVIHPNEVLSTLSEYDILLLPTYHPGEGYPGIIIEAYSIGIPCISTRWKAIPEIVEDEKTGYLIEPKNSDQLLMIIKSLDNEKYQDLSKNAKNKFLDFEYINVYNRIIKTCERIRK